MRETWRWFGEYDPIALTDVAQTGAAGVVSSLHAIPYGAVWPRDRIAARKAEIEAAGLTWDVVESLPVHEDIKRGDGDLGHLFATYRQSLANLAAEGVRTVCYNFMPILDWTRTDLATPLPMGGTCLRFSAARMAAFELHMLGRPDAEGAYSAQAVAAGTRWFEGADESQRSELLSAILSGLPGAISQYDLNTLRSASARYAGITHADLRANYARFLDEVVPTAAELGLALCVHPDDPPRDILGLPRIVSTRADIDWILTAADTPANGLTLCTGSLGAHPENDVEEIATAFADRTHFVHLRNVRRYPDGSFDEAAHLEGDVDLVAVMAELLGSERRSGRDIPFRADHGHALFTDVGKPYQPGYSLFGRMRGLAELRGILTAVRAA